MSVITHIQETDPVENAPAVINTNFDNLNTDKLETVSNVGTGTGTLVQAKSGNNVPIKTISAGSNITITNNANDVNIAATAPNPDASSTAIGVTKLSVDPASPTNPIALGTNDPLLTTPLSGTSLNSSTNPIVDKAGLSQAFPSGFLSMFAGSAAPSGWLICDGSAISRTTYANLFAVIASTYGAGDGSTTFNIPDLRSRFAVGAGAGTLGISFPAANVNTSTSVITVPSNFSLYTGTAVVLTGTGSVPTGLTASTTYYVIRLSATTIQLASTLANALLATPVFISLTGQGSGTNTLTISTSNHALGEVGGEETHGLNVSEMPAHTHSVNMGPAGGPTTVPSTTTSNAVTTETSGSTGGSAAHNNLPPYTTINYIIKT